jgi:signal transduction histidine kinase/ActR/RegA family two-component response regulator
MTMSTPCGVPADGADEQRFEALAELVQTVTGSLDLPEALERVAHAATTLLPDSAARIWVVEESALVLRAEAGTRGPARAGRATQLEFGEGLTGHVALTRELLVVDDLLVEPRALNADWMRREGFVSLASIPLLVRDRLLGVATFMTRHRHHFKTKELRLLTLFASQAAIAIQNARLFSHEQEREAYLSGLLEINKKIGALGPTDALLTFIAEEAARLLDVDNAGFRLRDGDDLVVAGLAGMARETMRRPRLKIGESLSGRALLEGQTLVADVVTATDLIPEHREADLRLGYVQVLVVPLRVGERTIGVLNIRSRRRFSRRDEEMAEAFADQAAIALENSRLYQEVRRAFDELSQTKDQLAQAQKMEAVGLLAGGVAHDFNNLLMVITGRSDLLLHRLAPGDPVRPDIELIKATGERAADLTRQLLAFSRKQMLQPKVLDLNVVVQGLARMLERLIGEDIELHAALDPALGMVKTDPGQIEQVLMNLAVNARDAMPDGGQLTIETSNVELDAAYASHRVGARPGPHVMVAVTDTGHGMDENTRARIFEPFFTTKEVGKGTGLGLSTVHGIINQSGGTVWVYSEPGKGTTFKIYLPRTEDDVERVDHRRAATPPARGSETILLVEDEKGVRDLVRDVLQTSGYTVLEARHGIEALAVARRHGGPIDLLLTDAVMPQMGGPELAECLVALQPGLKVLYMSGYTERTVVHHRVLDADVPYLQKPVTVEAVTRRVREVLDASSR